MEIEKMNQIIKSGQNTYINKTRLYLSHCMEWYGEEVLFAINSLNYFWCGINSSIPYCIFYIHEPCDNFIQSNVFYFRKYQTFFPINLVMHVLHIPKAMHRAYDKFVLGKYSKMYTREQMQQIFIKPDPRMGNIYLKSMAYPTLMKLPDRKKFYEEEINKGYDDDYSSPITIPYEYEFDSMWNTYDEILEFKQLIK